MPVPSLQPARHAPEECYWKQEKEYVLKQLTEIVARATSADEKLDSCSELVAALKVYEVQFGELSKLVGVSREEIASLKVKASLIGIGSAAVIELAVTLIKLYGTK